MSAVPQSNRCLMESVPDYRSFFVCSPFGLAQCQPDGTLIPLNGAMERIFEENERPSSSASLPGIVARANRSECQRMISELCSGARESFQVESATSHTGRKLAWTVWRARGQATGTQEMIAIAYPVQPALENSTVTQTARLETIGRMVGGIAHDFNNWVTGVVLHCDLLLASLGPNHPARKYAEEIRMAGAGATGFVRQLLTLAKPATSEPRLLSLNDEAEAMRSMLLRLIGNQVTLKLELDPKLGLVRIDPTQLQQILLNLVLNARDAMPDGGRILVATSESRLQILDREPKTSFSCALLAVQDNGIGMDADTRARIFEPFFTTKAGAGTGLGLATVHDIVTRHGGLIHVDSEPRRGTRVTVLLPVSSAPANEFYSLRGKVPSSTKEES